MGEFLSQLFGALDDVRALTKAAVSRLLTLFVTFIIVNIVMARFMQQWLNPWHLVLAAVMVFLIWRVVWVGLNRVTDAALVAAYRNNEPAKEAIGYVKQAMGIVLLAGFGFWVLPTYRSFTLTLALLLLVFLLFLSSPDKWNWLTIKRVSVVGIMFVISGLMLFPLLKHYGPRIMYHTGKAATTSYYITSRDTVEKWCFDCVIKDGKLEGGKNFSQLKDVKAGDWYIPVDQESPAPIDLNGVSMMPLFKAYDSKLPVKGFDMDPKRIAFVPVGHLREESDLAGTGSSDSWWERNKPAAIRWAVVFGLIFLGFLIIPPVWRYLSGQTRETRPAHDGLVGPGVHHAGPYGADAHAHAAPAPHAAAHAAAHEEHGGHGAGLPPAVWITLIVVLGIVALLFTQRWWNNIGTGPVYANNAPSATTPVQQVSSQGSGEQRGAALPVPGVGASQRWNPETQQWETPDFTTLSDFRGRWKVVVPANTEVFTDIQVKRAQTITFISRSGRVKNNPKEDYTNPPQGTYPIDIISPANPPYTLPEAHTGALLCRFSGNQQWFDAGGRDGNTYTVEVEEGQIVFAANTRVGERNFATGQFEVVFEIQ